MTTRSSATLVLVLVALAPTALALPILPSPPNDNMSNPAALALGSHAQSTEGATTEVGEPLPCGVMGATVWFQLVADQNGTLALGTSGSSFDTVLAAYADVPHADTLLGCNDDTNGTASYLEVSLVAGATYYVQAGGFNGNWGDLLLSAWMVDGAPMLPDLVLVDVEISDEGQSETFAVRAIVHNAGGTAPDPFQVTFSIDGQLVSTASYPAGMPAGYWLDVYAYPQRVDNGTHLLEVVADPQGTLAETDEGNNAFSLVLGGASLRNASIDIVSLERVPLRTEAGDLRHPLATYEAVLTLCNHAGGHDHVTVLLSLEGGGERTRVNLGGTRGFDLYSAELAPGECDTRRVRFDTATAVGDFTLVAFADVPGDAIPEDNVDTARTYNLVGDEVGFVLPLV